MLKKIRQKIEGKRGSSNLFWKGLIATKDFLWRLFCARKNYFVPLHLFPNHKVAYVEVSKAGCTSIKYALKDFRGKWDGPANKYFHEWFGYTKIPPKKLEAVLKNEYKDWTKFTVVRNPYDRFLSFYSDKRDWLFNEPLDKFIRKLRKSYWYNIDVHGRPQTRIIGEDLSVYNFVGRTENMKEVFSFLSKTFKKPIRLIRKNVSNKKGAELSNEQKEIIYKLYRKDFEILGYRK